MNKPHFRQPIDNRKSITHSQNFLKDRELIRSLIEKSSIVKEDLVYEIGAGKGIITEQLADYCGKVVALEVDDNLFRELRGKFQNRTSIEVLLMDFLRYRLPKGNYKIFSNIPFNITADIIRKLTEAEFPPEDSYLIVQKEAALRYMGSPHGKETQFSILLKPWFEMSITHDFRRTDFDPVPRVDSVLLRIRKRSNPEIALADKSIYNDFIVYSFKQWKPSLREGLSAIFTKDQFSRLSRDLRFSIEATPTDLVFEQWLGLFKYFLTGVNSHKKILVAGSAKQVFSQNKQLNKIHRTRKDRHWKDKLRKNY